MADEAGSEEAPSRPQSPEPDTPLLTVEEAAAVLRIGRTRAWDLVHDLSLPTVRIGAKRLVRRSDLDAFIAGLPFAENRANAS